MERDYEFKGASVEAAIDKGLKKLGLTKEEAEIEVVSENGGLFSKATVIVKPKAENGEIIEENEDIPEENEEVTEENGEEAEVEEKKSDKPRRDRNDRDRKPKERIDYFAEEKVKGKEYIERITVAFGGKYRVDAKSYQDEICFFISGDDANVFIGHRGETLDAIQYLVSQYLNKGKEDEERVRVTVDADFYRERRKRTLTALAKRVAAKAMEEKKEIALEPMNSYERRIIHSALQNSYDATTRSEGEGKDRHVVIVPKCEVMSYGNVSAEFRKKGPKKIKSYGQKKSRF